MQRQDRNAGSLSCLCMVYVRVLSSKASVCEVARKDRCNLRAGGLALWVDQISWLAFHQSFGVRPFHGLA